MSSYTITAREAQPTTWVSKNGDEITTHEQTQEERLAQQVPPPGEYRLKVISFAESFEMPKKPEHGGGMQTMTRLLLEVQEGPGKGKQTSLLCSWLLGSRSHLGKVYAATTGVSIENGLDYDPTEMLNGEFTAYLQPSKNLDDNGKPKGTDCSWDTVRAVSAAATNGNVNWS